MLAGLESDRIARTSSLKRESWKFVHGSLRLLIFSHETCVSELGTAKHDKRATIVAEACRILWDSCRPLPAKPFRDAWRRCRSVRGCRIAAHWDSARRILVALPTETDSLFEAKFDRRVQRIAVRESRERPRRKRIAEAFNWNRAERLRTNFHAPHSARGAARRKAYPGL